MRVTLAPDRFTRLSGGEEHDMSGNLERLLKAAGQKVPDSKPILEINPDHPMMQRLKYEPTRRVWRLEPYPVRSGIVGRRGAA